jgi:transcriptional regulator with XRE-family HTH domain
VARNLKRLRRDRGLTQADVASAARRLDLNWTTTTVVGLETGHRSIAVGELEILKWLLGATRYELLQSDRPVKVSGAVLTPKLWNDLHQKEPTDADRQKARKAVAVLDRSIESGEVERKAALSLTKRLGRPVSKAEVAEAAKGWGHSLAMEREIRARQADGQLSDGTVEAIARKRGHVTRDLLDELEAILRDG